MIVITQGRHTEFKEEFKGRKIDCEVLQNYTVSHTDYLSRISGCPLTQEGHYENKQSEQK